MSQDTFYLTAEDMLPLSIGCAFLGTGGGGSPYLGMLRAREFLSDGGRIEVISLDALPDDALVASIGGIGAPTVGIEKLSQGDECLRALQAMEAHGGRKVSALIAAEIGGANGIEPMVTAARAGLPVIDGDGMGRAFPQLQMTSFSIYGHAAYPAAIADEKGNTLIFSEIIDMFWLERFARSITVDMGGIAGLCTAPMRADFVRRAAIPNTVTQALTIGRAVLAARAANRNVVEALAENTGASLLFVGKITDVKRHMRGGFNVGDVSLSGFDAYAGQSATIELQNENLVCWVDGRVVASVPDLIINLEYETGEPLTTEVLRFGQRVAVMGLPVHGLLKTPEALDIVGPSAFGYPDLTFAPLDFA